MEQVLGVGRTGGRAVRLRLNDLTLQSAADGASPCRAVTAPHITILLEKLMVSQIVKYFFAFYQMFITMSTKVHNLAIQSIT
jgi:hypothetical protein